MASAGESDDKRSIGSDVRSEPTGPGPFPLEIATTEPKRPAVLSRHEEVVQETYTAAAIALGLLEDDLAWRNCLSESVGVDTPRQLRYLFVTILVHCLPSDALSLYEANEAYLMEDFNRRLQDVDRARAACLAAIEDLLRGHGRSPSVDYGLPLANPLLLEPLQDDDELFRKIERWAQQVDTLNAEQRTVYDRVMAAVETPGEVPRTFFVDGLGGTGKTGTGKVLSVAYTGIAASLMDGGKTVHSTFGTLTEGDTSSIHLQSERAHRIRNAALIVWDEAPMSPGLQLTVVDRLLKDVMNSNLPFGGMTMLERVTGNLETYQAVDTALADGADEVANFCTEFLNGLEPDGMPPFRLGLKVGCIVMCLRNIDPRRRLCNGTRLVVTELRRNNFKARILGGDPQDDDIVLPRMPFTSSGEDDLPVPMRRTQFPVRLSFGMTINKSQGQTFDRVGLLLTSPPFTHGQLYGAFSRVRNAQSVKVGMHADDSGRFVTKNIVYREVL